ncbi:MAG: hypothetical protein OEX10_08470 [Candidatus Bathyarchaeota archaeon]|nr:hypothetical protein [Candidatus Bathyarchaeota archaeon]
MKQIHEKTTTTPSFQVSCPAPEKLRLELLPHQPHMKRQPSRKYARATGVCVRSCAFK